MSVTRLSRKWRIGCRRWLVAGSLKTPIGVLTSLRRSGAATLLATAAFTGMLLAGAGCNTWGSGNQPPVQFRPSASETSRLLSNAHYYKLMGRPDAALKEMEEAHQADPNNLKIADALAQNYQELGQFQRAQEIYQEVLALQGSNRALQNNLCFSFYLQGNLTKAESCFQEALERDPGNLAARNNLGLLWCRQGKLADARRLWEEAEGVAGGQARMNQALAFLGMKAPTNYAKLPEAQPHPQAATRPKPAAPLAVTPPARPELAKASAPVKAPASIPPPALAPKVEQKVAAKPAEPKPAPQPQAATPRQPAAPVTVATPAQPELAKAPAPIPPPAVAPKVEQKLAAKPASPPQAAVPQPPAATTMPAATAKVLTAKASTTGQVSSPAPAAQPSGPKLTAADRPTPPSPPLTALERATTGIEVRNGTWTRNLAHESRSLLSQEGFNVTEIGNHIDFGAESTVIYYRPGAERVARGLNWEIFPKAKIAASSNLKAGVAIKILLGRDLMEQPLTMARLAAAASGVSPSAAPMTKPAAQPRPEAAKEPPAPVTQAAPAKSAPVKPQIQANLTAPATPKVAPGAPGATAASGGVLTAGDLINTPIEIRNGTRARNLAHQTRRLLSLEGFTVGIIGNHIDFGAEYTEIFYLPSAEKVARALNSGIFPGARLTPSSKLNQGMAIKVVLGHDLLERPRMLSRLAAEKP